MTDDWELIWEKSIAMAKTYHKWKSGKCSVEAFIKRKEALYKVVEKLQKEV